MYNAKVSEEKKKEVKEIQELFSEYPVVGLVDMTGLPALQLQRIKKQLRDKIVFKMSKKRAIRISLKNIKLENVDKLNEYLNDIMPAFIFTKENPFKLYKLLDKNKSSTKAKPGQKAPNDLIIKAGATNFTPGPIIGELGAMGLKTGVEAGKIIIKQDKVLVKKGEEISEKAADLLAKMGIEPMEVGLNLVVSYEKGEILTSDILGVSEEEYIENIKLAYSQSSALAREIGYISKDNIEMLIREAYISGKVIFESVKFPEDEIKEELKEAEEQAEIVKEKVEDKIAEIKEETEKKEAKPAFAEKLKEKAEKPKAEKKEIKETPLEEEIKKEKEFEEERAAEEPNDFKIEMKKEVSMSDVEKAQEVLRNITDQKIKESGKGKAKTGERKMEEKKEKIQQEEKELSKLINDLKDKKARGELNYNHRR